MSLVSGVVQRHAYRDGGTGCTCDTVIAPFVPPEHGEHVAQAALGMLTRRWPSLAMRWRR